ncbi:tape measure protein [Bacilliculturomica massiliensis]|uniref:tape measure protein n=1 Tax=Bacilliculturomica massiliensis TaxID=1917867 RepID=UPI0013EF2213|nr:tape measure protein [Bacilliculturomica massiliensis]
MPTISAMIALRDGMTGPLKSIIHANDTLINSMLSAQNASRQMIDTSGLRAARTELASAEAAINSIEESICQSTRQQEQLNNRMRDGTTAANSMMNSVKRLAAAYMSFQSVHGVLGLSDRMSGAQARLNLLVDDNGSVAALEKRIFDSAQRSRAGYLDVMQSVSKFGLLAGNAFSNNNEIIRFAELMNKNFVIAGASAQESSAAMYQLNQALGSGRLQGDEYRSIIENAPLLSKSIEDYMRNVLKVEGTMKEWSSKGMLTAEVIKNALFASADEIEARFEAMPMKFGQIWTEIGNKVIQKFSPILQQLSDMANGNNFQRVVSGAINALSMLAGAAVKVFGVMGRLANGIIQNWSMLRPVILGVTSALIAYKVATLAAAGAEAIANIQRVLASILIPGVTLRVAMANAAQAQAAVANSAAAASMWAFNAALLACPLTWIVLAIIALVAVIYLAVAAINKFAGKSISATGIIAGAFSALGAGIVNNFVAPLWNTFAAFINFLGNVFNHPIAAIQVLFLDLAKNVIGYILNIANAIEGLVNKIPGVNIDITSGIDRFYNQIQKSTQDIKDRSGWEEKLKTLDYFDYGAAFNTGYNWGSNLFAVDHGGKMGNRDPWAHSDVYDNMAAIAENTGKTASNTSISSEDLKYLRDIAERDVINRFTTAQLSITMNTDAHINSDLDIDGVIAQLEDKTYERLLAVAEGV